MHSITADECAKMAAVLDEARELDGIVEAEAVKTGLVLLFLLGLMICNR